MTMLPAYKNLFFQNKPNLAFLQVASLPVDNFGGASEQSASKESVIQSLSITQPLSLKIYLAC